MINKAIIVKVNGGTAYCEIKDDIPVKTDIFYDNEESIIGNIYIGHVKDVVKNINCAFVEYAKDKVAYLQLTDNMKPCFLNNKNTDKICEGDKIIIQITKEAIKTKDAVATTHFDLSGKYAILTYGHTGISFSSKIHNVKYKKDIQNLVTSFLSDDYGFLIRTNGYTVSNDVVISEIKDLISQYNDMINIANTRQKHYILRQAPLPFITTIRDAGFNENDKIITDDLDIYEQLQTIDIKSQIVFYEDKLLPLYKLYSLEKIFDDVKSRKVWLKSGGYLIIDYTEALTVIDVNTGKTQKGKNAENTFLNINLEAAREIARQLSLRNISGIIIIDFIDMKQLESRNKLILEMKILAESDRIKTTVVDFTKLNLMELTRRKLRDKVLVRDNLWLLP